MADETREAPPPLPRAAFEPGESPRAEVDLDCDECGAPLRWSPEEGALHCEHCDAVKEVAVRDEAILERPLSAAGAAATGLGRAVRVTECETCGARVTFEGSSTSESCPFCGSAEVLSQEARRNAIRPESLIPLEIGRENVDATLRTWIRSLWFRPNAIKRTSRFEAVGVYVPAWTFDAAVHSDWSAESGTYYWVTETYRTRVNGKWQTRTRRVRKVRWWPSWGQRDDHHDDVLVIASRGVDEELAGALGGFSTEELVPYEPSFLAGWRAEEYQVDLEEGWVRGQELIEGMQRSRCADDVPGDTHRSLRVRNTFRDVRWKHVLLPMWSVTYSFRGKSYAVLVNGQTGAIAGRAPYSWVKISLAVVGGLVLLAGVAALMGYIR
ncbi:MAG: zinc ribbon domain-containing protein [Planctomycetota bacterium]|nr:zinc ribbon domain-containing protein [Planctomycetota bacterium]